MLMRKALLLVLGFWMVGSLCADDLTRAVQQQLKDQGFFYGAVDGRGGEETAAAIRRYQIRNGLKVTGQLNDETLHALGMARENAAKPMPGYHENGRSFEGQSNDQYFRQRPNQNDDRRPDGLEDYNEMQVPQFMAPEVVTSLPRLFAGTIYERAPAQVQENVLYAVQGELMRIGLFRGVIDGHPGPATTDALVRLQQYGGLPVSGRLDNDTLNELRAFPGQRNGPPEEGFRPGPGRGRPYRYFPEPF